MTYGSMSKLRAPIDCKSLELELQEDLRAAELYRLQNDAKLRAVEQNVPTYEHFRQMVKLWLPCAFALIQQKAINDKHVQVNAAHLRPLERKDIKPKVGVFLNPVTYQDKSDSSTHKLKEKLDEEDHAHDIKNKVPQTYEEFIQIWKKMKTSDAKFACLRRTRNLLREKIFHVEIPAMLFNEVMNVCLESVQTTDNVEHFIEILQILSTCNRFRLTVNFMDNSEKKLCSSFFHKLLAKADVQNESVKESIESLAVVYNIAI